MEKMNDLKDLLKHELQDLYSVEEQIIEALPVMIDKASNNTLKNTLSEHLRITEEQKNRLDKIQKMMNGSAYEEGTSENKGLLSRLFKRNQVCRGMQGIIDEGNKIMNEDMAPEVLDAAIIAAAQKIEHYEICGYGTARTYARELGLEQVARLLEQTLNEEYTSDDRLTSLAVTRINLEAENGSKGGDRSASGSNAQGRTGKTPRETTRERVTSKEMELEPVSNYRKSSPVKGNSANERGGGKPKETTPPRESSTGRGTASSNSGRGATSPRKTVSNGNNSKTTGKTSQKNGRSSSTGRGSSSRSNSRGR